MKKSIPKYYTIEIIPLKMVNIKESNSNRVRFQIRTFPEFTKPILRKTFETDDELIEFTKQFKSVSKWEANARIF